MGGLCDRFEVAASIGFAIGFPANITLMTSHGLLRKLNDVPFKPFRIKLSNSTAIDVLEPGSVIVGQSSAVLPVETAVDSHGYRVALNWKTIALSHILEFADLNTKDNGQKRRRK